MEHKKTYKSNENDGWYIFRNMDAMQSIIYFDIAADNKVNQSLG